jgi:hypothetical protein
LSIKYLKAGNIDQQTQDRSEFLSAFLDWMPTPFESDLTHCVLIILKLLNSQSGDQNTCNVLFGFFQFDGWSFYGL